MPRRGIRPLIVLLICLILTAGLGFWLEAAHAAAPDPERHLTLERYLELEDVSDPRISPDGRQVIYTRRWVDVMRDDYGSALWIVDADGGRHRFLCEGSAARWSPDGTRIAYLAPVDGATQILVRWMDAEGATSQVTRVVETPRELTWSPDGRRIAFVMRTEVEPAWTVTIPSPPPGATWTEEPRVVDRVHYRQDRQGFLEDGFNHLFVVPADGGTPRQVTEGPWHVGARTAGLDYGATICWTPDGREILFDGLREEDADRRFRESHLHAVDVESGLVRQLTTRRGPWTGPVVSPDGKWVAYRGFPWSEQTYHVDILHLIPVAGGEPRVLTAGLDRSPEDVHWSPDGKGLYVTAQDRGAQALFHVSLDGRTRRLSEGRTQLRLASVSRDGWAAGVLGNVHDPGSVVRFRLAKPDDLVRLTAVNDDVLGRLELGEVEELWFESADGTRVQGWLVEPPGFDPAARYPLILHIHGGPHAMYGERFYASFQNLAAHGYLVLYTNPRGSTGYGTDFGNAIDNDYPGVDYEDLMAGVDAVIARGCVDEDRMYVTGVSGGGVLSAWTVAHTDRFAAAAVRAPVIDWISFAGTTDISAWGFFRYRTRFWEDPQLWLDHSPLMHVAKVRTPVLLMTGELDLRTPMGQTEEYYQALRQLGVETVMLRFRGEYHGTSRIPSNFLRTQAFLLDWFGKHARGDQDDESRH